MHTNSRLLFQKHAREFFRPGLRVLEIGPDKFPSTYCSLVADGSITWDTLDIWQDARLTYSATSEYSFPAPSDTYDIVLSGQVIEHVRKIWLWIKELTRVCKVGGLVITINPVSWPYHEHPIDCWRAYPEGMRALYEDASLERYYYLKNSIARGVRSPAIGLGIEIVMVQKAKDVGDQGSDAAKAPWNGRPWL